MWLLTGLVVGFALGFAVHRSDFCMHSAFRQSLAGKPGASVQAYLFALGIQLVAINSLAGQHLLTVQIPPVEPAAAVVGGLVFGLGMLLAKG